MQGAVWSSTSWKKAGPCSDTHLPLQKSFYVVFLCASMFVFIRISASKSDNLYVQMTLLDSLVSVLYSSLYLFVHLLHWSATLLLLFQNVSPVSIPPILTLPFDSFTQEVVRFRSEVLESSFVGQLLPLGRLQNAEVGQSVLEGYSNRKTSIRKNW